jgi:hypothetical protein
MLGDDHERLEMQGTDSARLVAVRNPQPYNVRCVEAASAGEDQSVLADETSA